jgi:hypothetical protein
MKHFYLSDSQIRDLTRVLLINVEVIAWRISLINAFTGLTTQK